MKNILGLAILSRDVDEESADVFLATPLAKPLLFNLEADTLPAPKPIGKPSRAAEAS